MVSSLSCAAIKKMVKYMKKTIGILGGMGPDATVNLLDLLVKWTAIEKDQDHIPTITYSNSQIPDRTAFILGNGQSPLPELIKSATLLEKAGADLILIPCITAHFFYDDIFKEIRIPFVHAIEEVLLYVQTLPIKTKRIGLIATTGTIQSGLFSSFFKKYGLEIIAPDEERQQLVMNAIYGEKGIKCGFKEEPKILLNQVLSYLISQKIDAIIGGCSEIPLLLNQRDMEIPFVDPMLILARSAIVKAGGRLKTTPIT